MQPAPSPSSGTEKYTPLSPASLTGGRRHKLKKVSAKTIKKTLKRLGMKPKGRVVIRGGTDPEMKDEEPVEPPAPSGGRRRKHTKKTHRRGRRLF
jgi:hypothetical protein